MTRRMLVIVISLGLISVLLVSMYSIITDRENATLGLNRAGQVLSLCRHTPDTERGATNHTLKVSLQDIRRDTPDNTFKMYDSVETFVMYIGHGRSGHSIVGSLLDAHPDVIIAHESDILGSMNSFRKTGLDRNLQKYLLFYRLEKNSEFNAMFGINAQNSIRGGGDYTYTYHVPGQWQGAYRNTIKVIGDKKGGVTSAHLQKEEKMTDLAEICAIVGVPVKFIHIIRNPFDNIATELLRGLGARNMTPGEKANNENRLNNVIQHYFDRTAANELLRQKYGNAVIDLPSRGFVLTPKKSLTKLCEFLGIICEEDYLEACAKIMHGTPSVTRNKVVWTEEQTRWVHEEIQKYSFLKEYNFDSP